MYLNHSIIEIHNAGATKDEEVTKYLAECEKKKPEGKLKVYGKLTEAEVDKAKFTSIIVTPLTINQLIK